MIEKLFPKDILIKDGTAYYWMNTKKSVWEVVHITVVTTDYILLEGRRRNSSFNRKLFNELECSFIKIVSPKEMFPNERVIII